MGNQCFHLSLPKIQKYLILKGNNDKNNNRNNNNVVADPEGVQGVRPNLPLRQNYLIYMEKVQKNHEK